MDFVTIILATLQATGKVLLITSVGLLLAYRGIMNPTTSSFASSLVKEITLPCLIFSQIGSAIAWNKLQKLWIVPAFSASAIFFGSGVGWLLAWILRLPKTKRAFSMVLLAFGNVTTIPLAMVDALISVAPQYFLPLDSDITSQDLADLMSTGSTYVLLCTLVNNFLRWTYGSYLLARSDAAVEEINQELLSVNDEQNEDIDLEVPEKVPQESIARKIGKKILKIIVGIETPVWACCLALFVGLIPPIKKIFFSPDDSYHAPLTVVSNSIATLGRLTVPLVLLTLGYEVSKGPKPTKELTLGLIFWITTFKLVIIPAFLGFFGVYFILTYLLGFVTDRLMLLVLIMEVGTPSAIALVIVVSKLPMLKQEISTLLFYEYLVGSITVSISVVFTLMLFGTMSTEI